MIISKFVLRSTYDKYHTLIRNTFYKLKTKYNCYSDRATPLLYTVCISSPCLHVNSSTDKAGQQWRQWWPNPDSDRSAVWRNTNAESTVIVASRIVRATVSHASIEHMLAIRRNESWMILNRPSIATRGRQHHKTYPCADLKLLFSCHQVLGCFMLTISGFNAS